MARFLAELKRHHISWAALSGVLFAAAVVLAYQQLLPARDAATAGPAAAQTQSIEPRPGGITIAVLPFANSSGDASQEFFSDGMTEEITAALAKVRGLTVLGRTSAFQFKGANRELRDIGVALGASYLVEGSVVREENRVRITAQLVQADPGTNVWTESYDRQFADVFAAHQDIAEAIAKALAVPIPQNRALVSNRTDDLELYQQYLRARALVRARAINQALAILEPALARDPNYAPAWELLAEASNFVPGYEMGVSGGPIDRSRRVVQNSLDKAEAAARKAIALDPQSAGGYAALGYVQGYRQEWAAADDSFRHALMLDSEDPNALHFYCLMLMGAGYMEQALAVREKLHALEPFVPAYNVITAFVLQALGRYEASIPLLQAIPLGSAVAYYRNLYLAMVYGAEGRYGMAADALLAIPVETRQVPRRSIEDAAGLLRSAPRKVTTPEALPALEGELNFVYAYIGALDRVLEAPERNLEIGLANGTVNRSVWRPIYAELRKTERFKAYLRKAGLVNYWRERGWPDLCHAVGTDDFACD